MACTPVITPYTCAPLWRTWRTYGANSVPMIPSPALVISVKMIRARTTGVCQVARRPARHSSTSAPESAADHLGRLSAREASAPSPTP